MNRRPLIALIKAWRGGEWLDSVLQSISSVDGVVAVLSEHGWIDSELQNNTARIFEAWAWDRPGWIHTTWIETTRQEVQYRHGLEVIRENYGKQARVLVVDTDEVWPVGGVETLRSHMDNHPNAHYFGGQIRTYLRCPLYEVWPPERGGILIGLQSAKEQPVSVRFLDRSCGPTVDCGDITILHFPYVRKNQQDVAMKFRTTSSQEQRASAATWLDTVWPMLPRGRNLHMTTGCEACWQEIKILARRPCVLPAFCDEIIQEEEIRWQLMLERDVPGATLIPTPNDHDLAKYNGDFHFGDYLRARLKMTYLEAIVLSDLSKQAGADSRILEIGCGSGASLAIMGLASDSENLWAIDPFLPYDEETHAGVARGVTEGDEGAFWETMATAEIHRHIRHIKLNSDEAAEQCQGQFDIILVDGNHSYEIVKQDLALYWPKVRRGGVLIAHDYTTRFPGVIRAMKEWNVPFRVIAGTSLAVARKA